MERMGRRFDSGGSPPARVAARLLPVDPSESADAGGGGAFALVMAHETPRDRGFALCLPLTEREPLLSGGLVSPSTMACGSGPVNGAAHRPVDGVGDNSGRVVDGPWTRCGQPGGLLGTTVGTANFFSRRRPARSRGRP